MYVVRLRIATTKEDEYEIDRRFHALSHLHNVMVRHGKALMTQLCQNKEYQHLKEQYRKLSKAGKKEEASEIGKQMNAIRKDIGLTKFGFESYLKICGARFKNMLSSQQVRKEADRVWDGAKRVLFGDGRELHFKKFSDFHTIGGKSNVNGAKFDINTGRIKWNKLNLSCIIPDTPYMASALKGKVSFCEIERKAFPNGWHYYLIVYIDGEAPKTIQSAGTNVSGIDMGVSSVAVVSDDRVVLQELAPKCKDYNKKIADILRRMDASRRSTNPQNYNSDGTVKKGKKTWNKSNTYKKLEFRLRYLYRAKSEYTRQSHCHLCNELLKDSNKFVIEPMNFKALAKRSKKTERQDKVSDVKQKDGTVKQIHKFKRKKRYGKTITDRSPGLFVSILTRKCEQNNGSITEVNNTTYKASQYRHDTDEFVKVPLSKRSKEVEGRYVQRDLYSAFLLSNPDIKFEKAEREVCVDEFKKFADMQDKEIADMKANNVSMKQCFGF